jgi:hypothetical protein
MRRATVVRLTHRPGLAAARAARLGLWLATALWACQAMAGGLGALPPAPAPVPSTIHTITLERGCMGCADAGVLVLRRDGLATHTVTGNARQGTADQTVRGHIAKAEFDKLAGLLIAQGFFALGDSYEDPQIRDGVWVTLEVVGQRVQKRVFSREGAGPAALARMASAVETARARIKFNP